MDRTKLSHKTTNVYIYKVKNVPATLQRLLGATALLTSKLWPVVDGSFVAFYCFLKSFHILQQDASKITQKVHKVNQNMHALCTMKRRKRKHTSGGVGVATPAQDRELVLF